MYSKFELISFLENAFETQKGIINTNQKDIQVLCPICKQNNKYVDYNKKKLSIRLDPPFITHCWVCGYSSKSPLHLLKTVNPNLVKEFVDRFSSEDEENLLQHQQSDPNSHKNCLLFSILDPIENKQTNQTGSFIQDNEDDLLSSVLRPLEASVSLPKGFKLLAYQDLSKPSLKAYKQYLKERGVFTKRDLWYWKFGISFEEKGTRNRIIIPSFDENGYLNYWTARTILPGIKPPYFNPIVRREEIVFNEINIDWNKELILVEGPFDLMKCSENATCILGSELNSNYKLFQKIVKHKTPIILALDPDACKKTIKLANLLTEYDIPVKILDIPSRFKDVGQMTHKQFMDLLPTAKIFRKEDSLSLRIKSILL